MKAGIFNIRWVVIFYSVVLMLVLYQTGENNRGTLAALASIGLTIFSLVTTKDRVYSFFNNSTSILLLFSVFYLTISQLFLGVEFSKISKFILQAFLTCMLFSCEVNEREYKYLKFSYCVAMFFYAILTIQSCMILGPYRYIHESIYMFGSEFDPNYIGIPLIAGTVFLLDEVLRCKSMIFRILCAFDYIIIVVAIVETSSRGNSLGLAMSNAFIIWHYYRSPNQSGGHLKKYLTLMVILIGMVYFFVRIQGVLGDNIERMTTFGEDADNNRYYLWNKSMDVFWGSPLIGGGLGVVAKYAGHASHNTYLQILSETGIVGALFFIPFFCKMFEIAWRTDKVMAVVLLSIYFEITFLNSLDNRCLWAIMGWIAMLPKNKCSTALIFKR